MMNDLLGTNYSDTQRIFCGHFFSESTQNLIVIIITIVSPTHNLALIASQDMKGFG
jgi:hypothetical protein